MEFGDDGITDAPNNYMKIAALILVFFVIVMLSFLKTGILKKNNQLYSGTYIFGKLLFFGFPGSFFVFLGGDPDDP